MNLKDLEKNAADLQAKLDEMKATITKMKDNKAKTGFFKPELYEVYFIINNEGDVVWTINEDFRSDKHRISIGNAYRTKEEAERARNKQEVTQRLRELAGGYRFKSGADNWYLFYWSDEKEWSSNRLNNAFHHNEVYFPTEEAALSARDELGQRLNVLLEIEE